jgi:hypothetical protein
MTDQRQTVSWEELGWSNHVEMEAIIRLLIAKGIIAPEELLNEVKQLQQEYLEKKT